MSYQSPFSQRYGSDEMRTVWSETARRRAWRRIWVAVAEAQAAAGLVTPEQIDDLKSHAESIDLERAAKIEAEVGHDLVAELRAFAEQCPVGGGILHWGLTSADVQDNAEIARQRAGLTLLLRRLRDLLLHLAVRIDATADFVVMGFTHLQPAEPTTLGYRLSAYAQDLLGHFEALARLRTLVRGKGIRGAVGTSAPFVEALAGTLISPETLEASAMQAVGIDVHPVATQTYPRVQDYTLISGLAGLAASMHKLAFDLRLMQSPGIGPTSEPFGEQQVGSSAMPFKRNPVKAEQVCSLARQVAAAAIVAWENAAVNLLERTLDDSANRRSVIPEAFLACDQMLLTMDDIVTGLSIDPAESDAGLDRFGAFAATERILNALVKAGADRLEMHARLRVHSLRAWEAIRAGKPNPLLSLITTDTALLHYLQPARLKELSDIRTYVGLAPERSRQMSRQIRQRFEPPAGKAPA